VALFESGRVYLPEGDSEEGPLGGGFPGEKAPSVVEPHRLGALAVGPMRPKSWRGGGEPADFFALKGVLEGLAARLGVELVFEAGEEPFLHSGRSASVSVEDTKIGWIGELHPAVCRAWDLDAATGFEVSLAPLVAGAVVGREDFVDITTFPAVLQDLAVVVPPEVPSARVRETVLAGGGELLRSAEVFDQYIGEQVGAGRKSLALRLEFRADDRTLTDEEVAELRSAIVAALKEIGGSIRD
jgi:phenylalanyl-tRNA synthetase beta chain